MFKKTKIHFTLIYILCFVQVGIAQMPLEQLEYAPDSTYFIGSNFEGMPIWKQISSTSNDSIYIFNDIIYLRDGSGFVSLANLKIDSVNYENDIITISTPYGDFSTEIISSGGGMDSLYNGDRPVTRVPVVGTNLGATTFRQWLDWWYTPPYTQPVLTFNSISPILVEVGSSNSYTLTGNTSNPCSFTLSGGVVNGNNFGAATTFSYGYTHQPTVHGTTTLNASQSWNQTGTTCESGTPTSGTLSVNRSIVNVYPVLWGMSATEYTGGSVPYNIWSKRVTIEGNQSALTMTGTNQYMYILIPKSWSDWTVLSIIDHNGFNVTSSFTGYDVTVTSIGLTNNWTQDYRLYKLNNLTTASGFNYIYNR